MATMYTMVPPGKQNLFKEKKYENLRTCFKVMTEHQFKNRHMYVEGVLELMLQT